MEIKNKQLNGIVPEKGLFLHPRYMYKRGFVS